MSTEKIEPPADDLGFVFDRVSILRAAHRELTAYGLSYDVADLLETAAWIAGDALPSGPEIPVWTSESDTPGSTDESEETGA